MLKEFKQFAMRGNMIDLAVGVVLGAAFGGVASSLVRDIITPPLGKILGGVDFSDLFLVLGSASYPSLKVASAGAATLNYGLFLNAVINFLLIAVALFFVVKAVNALHRAPPPAAPTEKDCPHCASRISLRATRCPHCTSALA